MAINSFPSGPAGAAGQTETFSFVIPDNASRYMFPVEITPGSYTVTCVSSTVTTIYFHKELERNPEVFTKVTSSGTITFIIEDTYDLISAKIDTGTNITVTFTRNGGYSDSKIGTLDTITTSGTYTQTGNGMVTVIGGGQAGTSVNGRTGGPGGASGKAEMEFVPLPGSVSVTIGAGGIAPFGSGGDTSFGSITASGGSPTNIGTGGGGGGNSRPPTASAPPGAPGGTDGTPGSGFALTPHGIVTVGNGGGGGGGSNWPGGNAYGGGGGGGGIYAGGGGGGGSHWWAPAGSGGGGGGGVAGSPGNAGSGPGVGGVGGAGGAGAVFVLRFPS